jgi:hypothetical protein
MSTYSRTVLRDALTYEKFDSPETARIFSELAQKALSNEPMSVAEADCVCQLLKGMQYSGERINIAELPACRDSVFKQLYLIYHYDLAGKYALSDFPSHTLGEHIGQEQKKKDLEALETFYKDWLPVVSKFNHRGDDLLNIVASESNDERKLLHKGVKIGDVDYREIKNADMGRVLNSKYVYLTVKEFFEEHGTDRVVLSFQGAELEITKQSLVHILLRHYAGAAKQFNTNKSFHQDRSIFWETLPYDLKPILEEIGAHPEAQGDSIEYLPIKYNKKKYGIWIDLAKRYESKKEVSFKQIETFYPIENSVDLSEIEANYFEVVIHENLSFFKPIRS